MVKVDVSMCPLACYLLSQYRYMQMMASREECLIKNMLARTNAFLEWSGLKIKDTKCAVFVWEEEWREQVVPFKIW